MQFPDFPAVFKGQCWIILRRFTEIALKELIVISTKRQYKSFFKILNKNVTLDSPKIRPHRRCLVCMLVDDFCRSAISTLLRQVVFLSVSFRTIDNNFTFSDLFSTTFNIGALNYELSGVCKTWPLIRIKNSFMIKMIFWQLLSCRYTIVLLLFIVLSPSSNVEI